MNKIEVGDTIEALDDSPKANVIAIAGTQVTAMPEDGFELAFHMSELVKAGKPLEVHAQHGAEAMQSKSGESHFALNLGQTFALKFRAKWDSYVLIHEHSTTLVLIFCTKYTS